MYGLGVYLILAFAFSSDPCADQNPTVPRESSAICIWYLPQQKQMGGRASKGAKQVVKAAGAAVKQAVTKVRCASPKKMTDGLAPNSSAMTSHAAQARMYLQSCSQGRQTSQRQCSPQWEGQWHRRCPSASKYQRQRRQQVRQWTRPRRRPKQR